MRLVFLSESFDLCLQLGHLVARVLLKHLNLVAQVLNLCVQLINLVVQTGLLVACLPLRLLKHLFQLVNFLAERCDLTLLFAELLLQLARVLGHLSFESSKFSL